MSAFEEKSKTNPWYRLTPYMNQEQRDNLKIYRYAGGDRGLVYVYFYNPVCTAIVEYLPDSLAPNLITLFGFFFATTPFFVLFGKFGTNMENGDIPIPNWFFFLEAFCYWAYRMFDEMDGKQARRTGNSSPLGLLFDHGCDAFVMGLQCLVVAKSLQAGNSTPMFLAFTAAISSFHFSTLEEYYTGGLFLGPGNGISDGSAGVIGIFLALGFFGNDWVLKPINGPGTMIIAKVLILFVAFSNFCIVLLCLKGILDNRKKEIKEGDITGEKLVMSALISQIFGYFLSITMLASILYIPDDSGKRIIDNPFQKGKPNLMFAVMMLMAFLMQHLTCSLQVNHVSKYKYSPWKNRLMWFLMICTTAIYFTAISQPKDFIKVTTNIIYVMLGFTMLAEWHYILNIVVEMANALDIRILCVKKKIQTDSAPLEQAEIA